MLLQVKGEYKEKYWEKVDRDLAIQLGCLDIRWVKPLSAIQKMRVLTLVMMIVLIIILLAAWMLD